MKISSLSGISTTNNRSINVATTVGTLDVQQAVAANGSGTVTLDANGTNASLTNNSTGTIDSGSGQITLTADAQITLAGTVGSATTGPISITADADGTLNGVETGLLSNSAQIGNSSAVGEGTVGKTPFFRDILARVFFITRYSTFASLNPLRSSVIVFTSTPLKSATKMLEALENFSVIS